MGRKKIGRRKGRKTRGYFYRTGRGWVVGEEMTPLCYPDGSRIRHRDADPLVVKEAYHRCLLAKKEAEAQERPPQNAPTIEHICTEYLSHIQGGRKATYDMRADTLFDLCYGLPPRFRHLDRPVDQLSDQQRNEIAQARIHDGYGQLRWDEFAKLSLDRWLAAHSTWKRSRRTHIQAIKRALNHAVDRDLIPRNPIRGYKAPRPNARVTYITPEQEEAMLKRARPDFRKALKVCIRTGVRFGSEFAELTAKQVIDHGDRMEWHFDPGRVKNYRRRVVRITDTEIIRITREEMKKHATGPVFRNSQSRPWTAENLSQRFRTVKAYLEEKGMEFDEDCCMYSCRHTYAKRTLQGYWTGKAINIETLAELMGDTPQTCRDYYLQWCESYTQPLWDAC